MRKDPNCYQNSSAECWFGRYQQKHLSVTTKCLLKACQKQITQQCDQEWIQAMKLFENLC